MALQDQQAEPSMEDILASIRRIISEEDEVPAAPVLELSEPAPAAPELEHDDIVFEADPEPDFVEPAPAAPAPVMQAPLMQAPASVVEAPAESILSRPAANASVVALQRLAGSLRIADTPGQTIEGVVRELLKPMLKEWLDQNLAGIVEAQVEAELERISRLAR